jgi:RND family efflux transporter MFP subunit
VFFICPVLSRSGAGAGLEKRVILKPEKQAVLSPASSGHVKKIYVKPGDSVNEGDLVMALDSSFEALEKDRLEQVIRKKEYDYKSLSGLLKDDMTSREETMQSKLELDLARIELKKAELRLEMKNIYAPFKGMIVKLEVHRGEWINQGQKVARIVDSSMLKGTALVTRQDMQKIRLNQELGIFSGYHQSSNKVFGKVVFIDPAYDAVTGLKMISLEIKNKNLLLEPGMEAYLNLENPCETDRALKEKKENKKENKNGK